MKYAIIENGKVINVAKADAPLADNWVQSDTAKKGDDYNSETGEFSTPAPVAKYAVYQQRDFVRKLRTTLGNTAAVAILNSTNDDVAAAVATLQFSGQPVDFSDPDTRADFDNLGLTTEQKEAIYYDLPA